MTTPADLLFRLLELLQSQPGDQHLLVTSS